MQLRNRVQALNFELPVEVGLCYNNNNNNNNQECEQYPRVLTTDLDSLRDWDGFDEWVGHKLSLINEYQWANIRFPDFSGSDAGYCFTVEDKHDLHVVLQDYVFALTKHILARIDSRFEKYNFVYNPRESYDFEFKKQHDRVLMVVEAECWHEWPELGTANHLMDDVSRRHYERLYAYMVMNQVEYAAVTNYRQTRFVSMIDNNLQISPAFAFNEQTKHTMIGALTAMILQASDYKMTTPASSVLDRDLEFDIVSYNREYKCGRIRFKDGKYNHREQFYYACGGYKRCTFDSQCMVKYQDVSKQQFDRLQWEAEVYKRLEPLQGEIVPELYNYGQIWDAYSILVLQRPGRPMTQFDLGTIRNARYKVMSLVKILHANNIVHLNIRPSSFYVNETDQSVMVAGLHKCQVSGALHRKMDEIEQVRKMFGFSANFSGANFSGGQKKWRQYKSRRSKAGWRGPYKHRYCIAHMKCGFLVACRI